MKREVGDGLKSKEISSDVSSQLEPVRNSYVTIMHQPVPVSSNTCRKMHVQIKHFLANLQDLIPTLAGMKYISNKTS